MSGSPRFGALDRFRPLAALLVVALHTYPLADVSPDAEFLLTRVLARLAVPFFLMATGQFALLPLLQPGGARRLPRFLRKTGLLYGACILLYLPLGIYGGQYAASRPCPPCACSSLTERTTTSGTSPPRCWACAWRCCCGGRWGAPGR